MKNKICCIVRPVFKLFMREIIVIYVEKLHFTFATCTCIFLFIRLHIICESLCFSAEKNYLIVCLFKYLNDRRFIISIISAHIILCCN